MPTTDNVHERVARLNKVRALVGAIDRIAVERGVDPLRRPADVLTQLRKLSLLGWCEVADLAHVHPPSEATQALVLAEYERRARLHERTADPRQQDDPVLAPRVGSSAETPHHVIYYAPKQGTVCVEFPSRERAEAFAVGKRYGGRPAVARPGPRPANFGRRSA
jgi:hypothetical protein